MNSFVIKLALVLQCLLVLVYSSSVQYESSSENQGVDKHSDSTETAVFGEYLQKNPQLLSKLLEYELKPATAGDRSESTSKDAGHLLRERRRLSVFKNVYQQCRVQKRKGKDLCLYLANLYQNVKGFHGL